jgi:hypothetical protein
MLDLEDEHTVILQNVGNYLQNNMAQCSRTDNSSVDICDNLKAYT